MGRFFKIFPNVGQNWLKFKKIWGKSDDFDQNLVQNWTHMNGSLFLNKLVFVWFYLQILWQRITTKPNLSTLQGLNFMQTCCTEDDTHMQADTGT